MPDLDYIERYNRQPIWVRVALMPLLFPVMLVHASAMMVFFVLLGLPYALCRGWMENRRFWRGLRGRGQVIEWADAAERLTQGGRTLVVEMSPKGPGCSWLLDVPRDQIDPLHVAPAWKQVQADVDVLETPSDRFEVLNQWTLQRLGAYTTSARALGATAKQLAGLADTISQQSVIAIPWICEGNLSNRCRASGAGGPT